MKRKKSCRVFFSMLVLGIITSVIFFKTSKLSAHPPNTILQEQADEKQTNTYDGLYIFGQKM